MNNLIKRLNQLDSKVVNDTKSSAWSKDFIESLSPYKISLLTKNQIRGLTDLQMSWLSDNQLKAFNAYQLQHISASQLNSLSKEQIRCLQSNQINNVIITPHLLKSVNKHQIKYLCGKTLLHILNTFPSFFSDDIINKMSKKQILKLTYIVENELRDITIYN